MQRECNTNALYSLKQKYVCLFAFECYSFATLMGMLVVIILCATVGGSLNPPCIGLVSCEHKVSGLFAAVHSFPSCRSVFSRSQWLHFFVRLITRAASALLLDHHHYNYHIRYAYKCRTQASAANHSCDAVLFASHARDDLVRKCTWQAPHSILQSTAGDTCMPSRNLISELPV